jgi:Tol biopolymer transport system component
MGGMGSFEFEPDPDLFCRFGAPQDATIQGGAPPITGQLVSVTTGASVIGGELQFQTADGRRVPGDILGYFTSYGTDSVNYFVSYTPPEGLTGTQRFRWRVNTEGCNASGWASLVVEVEASPEPAPGGFEAVSDFSSVGPGGAVTVDVLANDATDGLAGVSLVSVPAGFSARVEPDQRIRVTAVSATTPGRIRYRITGESDAASEADLVVQVTERTTGAAVYLAEELTVGRQELFYVDLATPGDSRLIGGGGDISGWALHPDGAEVAYTRYDAALDTYRIEFAELPSGTAGAPLGEGVFTLRYSPAGDRLAFTAARPDGQISLFLARPRDPSSVVEVGPVTPTVRSTVVPQVAPAGFAFTPDGQSLVYASNKTSQGGFELFEASVDEPQTGQRLHPAFLSGQGLDSPWEAPFAISADGRWVAYIADVRVDEIDELHLVDRANPTSAPRVVNGPLVPGGEVRSMAFGPGGIAYVADQDQPGNRGLYFVSLDGGSPANPVRIDAAQAFGGVTAFRWLPDGTGAVYAALQDRSSQADLYLVHIGLPGVTQRLTPAADNGLGVSAGFAISPNGAAVVYQLEGMYPTATELYVVELGLPGQGRRLHPPYPVTAGGGVETPMFAPDGHRLLFLGWPDSRLPYQLYLADLNDPGRATRLNGDLVGGGYVMPRTYRPNFGFVEKPR